MLAANHVALLWICVLFYNSCDFSNWYHVFDVVRCEQVTERGIGNGISMIYLCWYCCGLPAALGRTLEQVREGQLQVFIFLLLIAAAVVGVVAFVVFMERAQKTYPNKLRPSYAGGKVYAAQSTHFTNEN